MQEQKKLFVNLFIDQQRLVKEKINDWRSTSAPTNGLRNKISIEKCYGSLFEFSWDLIPKVIKDIKITSLKDWSNVKTIAFTPGVNVPRYKMQKVKESLGLSIIRDMSKADVIITSNKSIAGIVSKYMYYIDTSITVDNLKNYIMSHPNSLKIPGMTALFGFLNNTDPTTEIAMGGEVLKFINYYHVTEGVEKPPKYFNYHIKNSSSVTKISGASFTEEGQKVLTSLGSYNLVNENDFNALLGESVIDAAAYDMITKMIQSDSYEDRNLAISIIGNCNFVDSYKYALAWFIKNFDKIVTCRQPVAFKAFKNFIGYEKVYKKGDHYVFHIDQLLQSILANGVYHDGFIEELMQIDDLQLSWENSKLIKPVKFDITQEGKDIIDNVNQVI